MAKTSAAQQRAVHKYVKNNYDRLELSVPKGEKETIQQAAKQAGQKRKRLYLRSAMRQNAAGKRHVRHTGGG